MGVFPCAACLDHPDQTELAPSVGLDEHAVEPAEDECGTLADVLPPAREDDMQLAQANSTAVDDTPSEAHVMDAAPARHESSAATAVESEPSTPHSPSKSVPHLRHLVECMARVSGMPASTCHTLCQTILETVFACLTREESLTLRGLGTFGVRRHGARMGRNPLTGEALHIPAGKKARFTADKQLHAQINRRAQILARQAPS